MLLNSVCRHPVKWTQVYVVDWSHNIHLHLDTNFVFKKGTPKMCDFRPTP